MDQKEVEFTALERVLLNASLDPIQLSYDFLEDITEKFSKVIGDGGFGIVYMGCIKDMKVAVKKLFRTGDFSDVQFGDELQCLRRVKHENIVRCLGYCSDTKLQPVEHKGKVVLAEERRRLLCFEYIPNRSLHEYLKDENSGREWEIRYQLIVGICRGLQYLHNEGRINHLDLKPANILLDANMVPKITDFGLSRRFSGAQSRKITENIRGSLGYMAPEYWRNGEISFKADIYSLGIIIRNIVKGSTDVTNFESWYKSLDAGPQLKRCFDVAQQCADHDQHKRPTINLVIEMLTVKEHELQMGSLVSRQSRYKSSSVQQASISAANLVDKVQLMEVSASASHSQLKRITKVPKGPGEASTTEASSLMSTSKAAEDVESVVAVDAITPSSQQNQPQQIVRGPGEQSIEGNNGSVNNFVGQAESTSASRPPSLLQQITTIPKRHGETTIAETSSSSVSNSMPACNVQPEAVFQTVSSQQQQQQQQQQEQQITHVLRGQGGQTVEDKTFVPSLVDEDSKSASGSTPPSPLQHINTTPDGLSNEAESTSASRPPSSLQQTTTIPKRHGETTIAETSSSSVSNPTPACNVQPEAVFQTVSSQQQQQQQQQQITHVLRGQGGQTVEDKTYVPSLVDEDGKSASGSAPPSPRLQRINTTPDELISSERNSFVHDLVDEAPSIFASKPSSPLQQITDVRKGLGEASTEISKLLDVYPRQLCFPFEPNKLIRCAVTLTNKTEYYVGVWITLTYPDKRLGLRFPVMCGNESFEDTSSYFTEMMDPYSTLAVPMTMKELQRLPPWDTGKFEVLMIVMRQKEHIKKLTKASNMESDLLNRAQELGAMVNSVILTASILDSTSCPAVIANYKFMPKRTSFWDVELITDVHPTKTWFLARQKGGCISIWNYQTQERMVVFQVTKVPTTQVEASIQNRHATEKDPLVNGARFRDPRYRLPADLYSQDEVGAVVRDSGRLEGAGSSEMLSTSRHGRSMGGRDVALDGRSGQVLQTTNRWQRLGRGAESGRFAQGRVDAATAGYWRRGNHVRARYRRPGEANSMMTMAGASGRNWWGGGRGNQRPQRREPRFRSVRRNARYCLDVRSAKFIAREHWLVTGDDDGSVHVYTYRTMEKIQEFIAHHDRHAVDLLSVHPTCQFLLTASSFVGTSIKLWDWGQAWICIKTINMPNTKLHHLSWNPRETNGFASVLNDRNKTLKIWKIDSPDPITTMEGVKKAGYLCDDSQCHTMVTTSHLKSNSEIWDLQSQECVHRLGLSGWDIYDIACHPTLPILATSHSYGRIVCLWDTKAYRLEAIVELQESHSGHVIFL